MQPLRLHNLPHLGQRRRLLSKDPTSAEKYLWRMLKSKLLSGRKFRRQHGIGSYIVDFYCASEKLIIELDGEVHDDPEQIIYDLRRDHFLQEQGFKILRVKNELVYCNVVEVLRLIEGRFDKEEL